MEGSHNCIVTSYALPATADRASCLPVLVYHGILPELLFTSNNSELAIQSKIGEILHKNEWEVTRAWPSITTPHFHPNVHELYAVIQGSSTLVLGLDVKSSSGSLANEKRAWIEISVETGDVIVIPAGVSHCSRQFDADYRYVAAYPSNGEHWKSVNKHNVDKVGDCRDVVERVPLPICDPILGRQKGGLLDIWGHSR